MDRRIFLTAVTSAALASANAAPELALEGGTPVRSTPLVSPNWGPLYYDDKEQTQLTDVLAGP